LLTLLWLAAVLAWIIAGAALMKARLTAKRFERLSESYWELRYEHGQLASRLSRLETARAGGEGEPEPAAGRAATTSFVPLSSLKR
jgi:hypothetical protein